MPCLSPEILPLLSVFQPALTAPTWANLQVLLCGVILAPGRRTVASALRVLGLERQRNFSNYHRFLSRAHWSSLRLSRLLLTLLIRGFVPPGAELVLLFDDTLERRRGKRVDYRGLFRDPVRSTAAKVSYCWGIRWLCVALLVGVPWSQRPWALPFLLVPVLSEKTCQRLKRRHRTLTEWAALVVAWVRRWQPERRVVVVGDGSYAAVALVEQCQAQPQPVTLVSRLRLDAVLHDFPEPKPKGKRGPQAKKGKRQASLAARLEDPQTQWQPVTLRWYGGKERTLEIATGSSLWYRPGHAPVPLRWVLVRAQPAVKGQAAIAAGACFCSEPEATPEQILGWFIGRWNIEVTFEEIRAHLGFETQRHWCRRALGRATPCLFGVFSLVVVIAKQLHPERLPLQQSAWYEKQEATFSDALAAVRRHFWSRWGSTEEQLPPALPPTAPAHHVNSPAPADQLLIPVALWQRLQHILCYAT